MPVDAKMLNHVILHPIPISPSVMPLPPEDPGLRGVSDRGIGVLGQSTSNSGVVGTSAEGQGLTGFSDNSIGIFAQGATFSGVFNGALVVSKGPNPKNTNIPPSNINGSIIIREGSLFINSKDGDIILANADCAEDFDISSDVQVEAGTVMVLDPAGMLTPSDQAYDRRVAGVLSGAGDYRPGIVLDKHKSDTLRMPLALMGKVYCKVDADHGAIDIGDLLTTSSTIGHAMKAADLTRAFGAVIGKALRPLQTGQGLIPILVVRH